MGKKIKTEAAKLFSDKKYLITAGIIATVIILQTINGYYVGDFWEHNAVIKELSTNIASPLHPQLSSSAPHAFYTPYSVILALISKSFNINTISVLEAAGIINLILLLTAFKIFTTVITKRKNSAFYSLIFLLLLWGDGPWSFSGFFHLNNLKYIVSYPSTFAAALMFIVLWLIVRIIEERNTKLWIVFSFLLYLIVLTHPITFIATITGITVISIIKGRGNISFFISLAGSITFVIAAAGLWPYYPFYRLILIETSAFHGNNFIMYEGLLQRLFPLLIGIPIIILRLQHDRRDILSLIIICLCFVYVIGWLTAEWSFGRVISFIAIFIQIIAGDMTAQMEEKFVKEKGIIPFRKALFNIMLIIFIMPLAYSPIINSLYHILKNNQNYKNNYTFLTKYSNQYDIILSDIETSWIIPSFGGKVVAAKHPLAFIPDQLTRVKDVERFFSDSCSVDEKQEILLRYRVNMLLINKQRKHLCEEVMRDMLKNESVVFENDTYLLIRLGGKKLTINKSS